MFIVKMRKGLEHLKYEIKLIFFFFFLFKSADDVLDAVGCNTIDKYIKWGAGN